MEKISVLEKEKLPDGSWCVAVGWPDGLVVFKTYGDTRKMAERYALIFIAAFYKNY